MRLSWTGTTGGLPRLGAESEPATTGPTSKEPIRKKRKWTERKDQNGLLKMSQTPKIDTSTGLISCR